MERIARGDSPLHHCDGFELDGHLGDVGIVASLHNLGHVLVTLWSLLHDELGRRYPDRDAHVLQALEHVAVVQVVPRLVPAEGSARAVAGAAERVAHALVSACQDVGARAHGPTDDHWLPSQLVIDRDERVVRRECACGAFPVHEQLLAVPIDHVLLDLGDVVRDVVDDVHVQVFRRLVEHLGECLPGQKGHRRPVHPSVIGRRRHAFHVVLAFNRIDPRTSQLAVVRFDVIPRHGTLHLDERIRGDLVAQAPAA
mmetsp:Transcript_22187/g.66393  ORF Transcript_22187/g.66393 Transcript_22187/m.66393 type:complete len:255 (+) Transcript_22187:57-821(+)